MKKILYLIAGLSVVVGYHTQLKAEISPIQTTRAASLATSVACSGGVINFDSGTAAVDCTNNKFGVLSTAPVNEFHIGSGGQADIYQSMQTDSRLWKLGIGSAGGDDGFILQDTNASSTRMRVDTTGDIYLGGTASGANPTMLIRNAGDVGIGNGSPTVPATTLEVSGSLSAGSGAVKSTIAATGELSLDQGTNDNNILSMSSLGDIAQPATLLVPTQTFAVFKKLDNTAGGLSFLGLSDTDATASLFRAVMGASNPTDTTPALQFRAGKSNGTTGATDLGAAETMFSFEDNSGNDAITVLGNGNTGLGRTNPSSTLDVNGAEIVRGQVNVVNSSVTVTAALGSGMLEFREVSNNTLRGSFGIEGSGANYGAGLYWNGTQAFTVESNAGLLIGQGYQASDAPLNGAIIQGIVGINDTTPDATLEVKSTQTAGGYVLAVSSQSDTLASLFGVLGDGQMKPAIKAKAEIDTTTAIAGGVVICSDCTVPYDICVGTGTTLSGFRAVVNSAINTAVPGTLVNKGCGSGN